MGSPPFAFDLFTNHHPKKETMTRSPDTQDSLSDTSMSQNDCLFDGEVDLDKLIDTEINLGKGHQGVVRLMILNNGKNQYVAVKVLNLDDKDRYGNSFEEEALVWKELDKMSCNSKQLVPKLFGIKTVTTTDKRNFGIIVSELGVPVNDIFSKLHKPKEKYVGEDQFKSFFKNFRKLSNSKESMELPVKPPTFEWLHSLKDEEKSTIKENIFKSLSSCILPGFAENGVLHKDLKTDNFLYLPNSGTVVACDFGVSYMKNSDMNPLFHGYHKYYPVQAIANRSYYEPLCDEFFASLSLLEILLERKIYPDLNTNEIIALRKNGIKPKIPKDVFDKHLEATAWIEEIWNRMDKIEIIEVQALKSDQE